MHVKLSSFDSGFRLLVSTKPHFRVLESENQEPYCSTRHYKSEMLNQRNRHPRCTAESTYLQNKKDNRYGGRATIKINFYSIR